MIMRANVPGRLSLRMLGGIVLLGLVSLPAWTQGQDKTTAKPGQATTAERDKQLQDMENKLQGVLRVLKEQRKPVSKEYKVDTGSGNDLWVELVPPANDKKLQELEAKVKALLKEVQDLRGRKSPQGTNSNQGSTGSIFVDLDKDGRLDVIVANFLADTTSQEVTLSRTTYKLPAAKAEALGKFLQEHVKAVIMETKADGDSLTITTTPEAQQGIRQFIALIEGKTPPRGTRNLFQERRQLAK